MNLHFQLGACGLNEWKLRHVSSNICLKLGNNIMSMTSVYHIHPDDALYKLFIYIYVYNICIYICSDCKKITNLGLVKLCPRRIYFPISFSFRVDVTCWHFVGFSQKYRKFRLPFHPLLRRASAILAASEGTGHQSEFLSSARRLCPDQRAKWKHPVKEPKKTFKNSSPFWGRGQRNLRFKLNISNTVCRTRSRSRKELIWH